MKRLHSLHLLLFIVFILFIVCSSFVHVVYFVHLALRDVFSTCSSSSSSLGRAAENLGPLNTSALPFLAHRLLHLFRILTGRLCSGGRGFPGAYNPRGRQLQPRKPNPAGERISPNLCVSPLREWVAPAVSRRVAALKRRSTLPNLPAGRLFSCVVGQESTLVSCPTPTLVVRVHILRVASYLSYRYYRYVYRYTYR